MRARAHSHTRHQCGFAVIAYAAFVPQRVFGIAFARHSLKRTRRFRVSSIQKAKKVKFRRFQFGCVLLQSFQYQKKILHRKVRGAKLLAIFHFIISSIHLRSPVVHLDSFYSYNFVFFLFFVSFRSVVDWTRTERERKFRSREYGEK